MIKDVFKIAAIVGLISFLFLPFASATSTSSMITTSIGQKCYLLKSELKKSEPCVEQYSGHFVIECWKKKYISLYDVMKYIRYRSKVKEYCQTPEGNDIYTLNMHQWISIKFGNTNEKIYLVSLVRYQNTETVKFAYPGVIATLYLSSGRTINIRKDQPAEIIEGNRKYEILLLSYELGKISSKIYDHGTSVCIYTTPGGDVCGENYETGKITIKIIPITNNNCKNHENQINSRETQKNNNEQRTSQNTYTIPLHKTITVNLGGNIEKISVASIEEDINTPMIKYVNPGIKVTLFFPNLQESVTIPEGKSYTLNLNKNKYKITLIGYSLGNQYEKFYDHNSKLCIYSTPGGNICKKIYEGGIIKIRIVKLNEKENNKESNLKNYGNNNKMHSEKSNYKSNSIIKARTNSIEVYLEKIGDRSNPVGIEFPDGNKVRVSLINIEKMINTDHVKWSTPGIIANILFFPGFRTIQLYPNKMETVSIDNKKYTFLLEGIEPSNIEKELYDGGTNKCMYANKKGEICEILYTGKIKIKITEENLISQGKISNTKKEGENKGNNNKTYTLYKGWNMLSINPDPIIKYCDIYKAFYTWENGKWHIGFKNDTKTIDLPYYVYLWKNCRIPRNDIKPYIPSEIILNKGWNMIPGINNYVEKMLIQCVPSIPGPIATRMYNHVYLWNPASEKWETVKYLEAGKAYWVYSFERCVIKIKNPEHHLAPPVPVYAQ